MPRHSHLWFQPKPAFFVRLVQRHSVNRREDCQRGQSGQREEQVARARVAKAVAQPRATQRAEGQPGALQGSRRKVGQQVKGQLGQHHLQHHADLVRVARYLVVDFRPTHPNQSGV